MQQTVATVATGTHLGCEGGAVKVDDSHRSGHFAQGADVDVDDEQRGEGVGTHWTQG
jgi:hypothetical protein